MLLGSWISGCATLNPGPRRENFAPLFIYSEDEKKEGRALDALGPFFSYRKDLQEKFKGVEDRLANLKRGGGDSATLAEDIISRHRDRRED